MIENHNLGKIFSYFGPSKPVFELTEMLKFIQLQYVSQMSSLMRIYITKLSRNNRAFLGPCLFNYEYDIVTAYGL